MHSLKDGHSIALAFPGTAVRHHAYLENGQSSFGRSIHGSELQTTANLWTYSQSCYALLQQAAVSFGNALVTAFMKYHHKQHVLVESDSDFAMLYGQDNMTVSLIERVPLVSVSKFLCLHTLS